MAFAAIMIGILHRQVDMAIDEAGQNAAPARVYHRRIAWNRDVTPYADDALALDE
jgi:hypothetical protein